MANKLQAPATAGFNAIGKNQFKMVSVDEIVIDPEISSIFKIDDKLLKVMTQDMIKHGFDGSHPVILQKDTKVIADGHTRLQAAKNAGIKKIPAVEKEFSSRDELLLCCFTNQAIRRNLSGAGILAAAQMMPDTKRAKGEGSAAKDLADQLGISESTVKQARLINSEAPEKIQEEAQQIVEEVKNGNISIKKGSQMRRELNNKDNEQNTDISPQPRHESSRDQLLASVIQHLIERDQIEASEMIVTHFFKKAERIVFIKLLPKAVSGRFSKCTGYTL